MRRYSRQILAALTACGASVLTMAGCADNESSLFIVGVMVPGDPPDCDVQASSSAPILGEGNLDVALSSEFRGWLLVGNQLTPRGAKQRTRTETARVSLKGAEVTLSTAEGDEIDSFSVPGTGFVSVNRSEEPAYGAFLATLIPPSAADSLRGTLGGAPYGARVTVVATVKVYGDTLGGQELESAEFSYPIQVCSGCLVTFPIDAIDVSGECSLAGGDADTQSCFFGQSAVDCRVCANSYPEVCGRLPSL